LNFYKRYLGDYARDTAHLTLIEHGAYQVLLDTYYATEEPLPTEAGSLYRIAKAFTAAEKKAVMAIVSKFFPIGSDGLRHNKRADEEITKRAEQADTNRSTAIAREAKRKENKQGTNRSTNRTTNAERIPEPEPEKEKSKAKAAEPPATAEVVGSIPNCPHESVVAAWHEAMPDLPRVKLSRWPGSESERNLRSRWREGLNAGSGFWRFKTAEEGVERASELFKRCRDSEFLMGRASSGNGHGRPFVMDLHWLLVRKNFDKVLSGRYHEHEAASA
jgi:uncharacterized protein YdaU (DUF1376 family)